MKRMHKLAIVGILFAVTMLFGLSTTSLAHPGYTQECDLCHTNTGNLGLSSNATGTVDATVGDAFNVVFNADSGSTGISLAIESTWADNSQFIVSDNLVEDNEPEDTNSADGELTVAITFTPLTNGTFTIRVWVASSGAESTMLDLTVDVAESEVPITITTTTSTTPPPDPGIDIWYMMLYTVIPLSGVVLIILGIAVFRNTPKE